MLLMFKSPWLNDTLLGSPSVLENFTEGHYEHDLSPEDRSKLQIAASSRKTHVNIACLIGVNLGFLFAYRIRANRNAVLTALGAFDRPSHVVFPNGRVGTVPELRPLLRPAGRSDYLIFTIFPISGFLFGGITGMFTYVSSSSRMLTKDPESERRIGRAFSEFAAETHRKQADEWETMRRSELESV